ncbi:retrovirus-related pol polyprotein from transposon TNT 1-94 [Tanacetum coccineum]
MLTKPQFFYEHTTKQALGFQNPFYLKKAQQLEPKLYDSNVIKNTSAIVIPNSEKTPMLAEESRSKMLLKQKDPMMLEKKVNTILVDYAILNQLSQDFETQFVPQTELSAKQAFWSQNSMNSSDPTLSSRPIKVKVPKELSKANMVNTSLKKLMHHLAGFDVVVKERTTTTAIIEGSWGFKHTKACFMDEIIPFVKALKDLFNTFDQYLIVELSEVQNVFHQMEQAVEQHLNVHECEKCLKLETGLLNKKDFVEKETYDKLFRSFTTLEKHCISLEVDTQLNQENFQRDNYVSNQSASSFDQYFELNELKAQSQEKDTVIKKLKERIKSLSGKMNKDKIKKDLEEIETINIELDHRVSKLIVESEHLKQTYKQLYDSIKPTRIRSKEQCDDLINQEEAAILREIVEQGKSQNPLNESLDSACKYTKQIQELLIIVGQTCPSINNSGDKLVAVIPKNKDKRVRFTEPVTSSGNTNTKTASSSNLVSNKPMLSSTGVKPSTSASGSQPLGNTKKDKIQRTPSSTQKNKVEAHPRTVKSSLKNKNSAVEPKGTANVQHSKLNANSEPLCVKCNGCMLSDNHDLCVLDFINDVNARTKSKSVKKSSKRKVWKPTGKDSTTAEVPLRKPTALESDTPKPVVTLVYSRKPKKSKTNVPVSKPKNIKSLSANKKEPSKSWGSIVSDVPSSSLDECRYFQITKMIMCKILGYGDYQIENVTISRDYYVEGLGHNLFSAGHGLVRGLPKLNFKKDHLCSACAMGKSKKKPHKPKSEDTNQEKLYLLHMDLCGPMRVASVNGKKYILVIVDDYSRFTWVKCLRSKDKAPDFIIKFLKMIQVRLYVLVRRIRTDNGTEFINQTLREYYEKVGISYETSVARSPQQNGVVKRRNRTLIEDGHTMLIYAKALLFLWAEAVATASYTQNHSIVRLCHGKTPYELLHDKPPDLSFFYVFGALCYLTNDSENLGKLQLKSDIGIFIGYAPIKKAFRIYNRRTRRIIETIHVDFDELNAMASEHSSSGPALHEMIPATISSGLVPNPPPLPIFIPPSRTDWDILFQPLFDELLTPPASVDYPAPEVVAQIHEVVAPVPVASTGSPSSTNVDQDAPSPIAHMGNDPYFGISIPEVPSDQSSSTDPIHTIVHPDHQIFEHNSKWTKDHLLKNIIGELGRPVSTRLQLHEQALFCYAYDASFLHCRINPRRYIDALTVNLDRSEGNARKL